MKKILIVEDELIVRSIYRRKFEISGYQVETAEEGTAALESAAHFQARRHPGGHHDAGHGRRGSHPPDRAWPDFKTIPILVISSFYRPDLAKEAWKAGATKCVSKMDCTPNLALELVEQMLSGENAGLAPFAKAAWSMPERGAFVCAGRIAVGRGHPDHNAQTQACRRRILLPTAPAPAVIPAPKPPSTLPTFAKEQPAPTQPPRRFRQRPSRSAGTHPAQLCQARRPSEADPPLVSRCTTRPRNRPLPACAKLENTGADIAAPATRRPDCHVQARSLPARCGLISDKCADPPKARRQRLFSPRNSPGISQARPANPDRIARPRRRFDQKQEHHRSTRACCAIWKLPFPRWPAFPASPVSAASRICPARWMP